jgi:glycosyltransferase involved in cell wall biosynthesis
LIGGAQKFLINLTPALIDAGWRISVLSEKRPGEEFVRAFARLGVEAVYGLWREDALIEDVAPVLAERVNAEAPDLFLISVSPGVAWAALPYPSAKVAVMAIAHTDSETFYLPVRHYGELLDGAVGVSQEICRRLVADCHLPNSRVFHQPYGVMIASAEQIRQIVSDGGGRLRLIYVGRLEQQQKRIHDLVPIVKGLGERGVDFELEIVGDGPERQTLTQGLAAEVEQGRARFSGWLNGDAVIDRLRRADVLLLTSAYEGLPLALLEGMGNGAAPIVTDLVSGHRQLITHGENGFLIPVGDIAGFVEQIAILNRDRNRLRRVRMSAWETACSFSAAAMGSRYAAMFDRILAASLNFAARRPQPDFPLMVTCRSRYPLWLRRMKGRWLLQRGA